jgi:hypothetical protein
MRSERTAIAVLPLIIGVTRTALGHRWLRPSKCPAAPSSSRMLWRKNEGRWKVTLRSSIRILLSGTYKRVRDHQRPDAAT